MWTPQLFSLRMQSRIFLVSVVFLNANTSNLLEKLVSMTRDIGIYAKKISIYYIVSESSLEVYTKRLHLLKESGKIASKKISNSRINSKFLCIFISHIYFNSEISSPNWDSSST